MPTFKNSATTYFPYRRTSDGKKVLADPGTSFETYYDYSDATQIVEESAYPYYNPVTNLDHIIMSASGWSALAICSKATAIDIFNISSAEITPYAESSANTPALHSPLTSTDELTLTNDDNVRTIVLSFSAAGSCWIKQRK